MNDEIVEFSVFARKGDLGPFDDFVRRVTWTDIRKRTETDDEAYQVMRILEDITRQANQR